MDRIGKYGIREEEKEANLRALKGSMEVFLFLFFCTFLLINYPAEHRRAMGGKHANLFACLVRHLLFSPRRCAERIATRPPRNLELKMCSSRKRPDAVSSLVPWGIILLVLE